MASNKARYYVDLIDGKVTTGMLHPFYKRFKTLEQAEKYSEIVKQQSNGINTP